MTDTGTKVKTNSKEVICVFCTGTVFPTQGVHMYKCGHAYHKDCLEFLIGCIHPLTMHKLHCLWSNVLCRGYLDVEDLLMHCSEENVWRFCDRYNGQCC